MDYIAESPKLIPVLITLTVKNGPDLGERYRHLKTAFGKIRKRRSDSLRLDSRRGLASSEFGKIDGAVYSFEQTYNPDTGWHPHAHIMAFLTDYLDLVSLSQEWHDLTGDSFIVDARRIYPNFAGHGALGIEGALSEVYKYAVKLSDMTNELTWHAYTVLRGKRLTGALGALYGRVVESDELMDEEIDDTPYVWRFYRWSRGRSTYDIASTGTRGDMNPVDSVGCRASLDGADNSERRPLEIIDPASGLILPY